MEARDEATHANGAWRSVSGHVRGRTTSVGTLAILLPPAMRYENSLRIARLVDGAFAAPQKG